MNEILTMPPAPWIDLPEGEAYAWDVTLAGVIGLASQGVTTELRWNDGTLAAIISPPPAPDPAELPDTLQELREPL